MLELVNYTVDTLWSDAMVTEQDGEVSLLVSCPVDCTPGNLLVRGTDIPIARATLRVRASAAPRRHPDVLSLRTDSMLNFVYFSIVEPGLPALVAGPGNDATTTGELTLVLPQPVGLFVAPQASLALALACTPDPYPQPQYFHSNVHSHSRTHPNPNSPGPQPPSCLSTSPGRARRGEQHGAHPRCEHST